MSFNQQDAHNLLTQLVSFKSDSINYVVYIFQALYMVSGLILLLVVLNLFILNKKQALIDKISNTVTIKLNASLITPDGNANVKTSKAKRNYGLPGEIHEGFEEIDKL
jgi:hypothetical protein